MRKIISFSLYSFLILLTLGACSNNTSNAKAEEDINKLNLEEEIFNKGNKILQMYYKTLREDTDISSEEYDELSTWFEDKSEIGEYSSVDEEYFVSSILVIKSNYELYLIQKGYEDFSGEEIGESSIIKEEIQERLLESKEEFGVKFKN